MTCHNVGYLSKEYQLRCPLTILFDWMVVLVKADVRHFDYYLFINHRVKSDGSCKIHYHIS